MSAALRLPVIDSSSGFYKYLQQINKIPSLTQEEEFLLAKAYLEEQSMESAHKLVASHLKLVAKIAVGYKNYGLPVQELVSEGNLGLMQAVKKFNPSLGFRLSTYAMWWIKAAIQEYILKSWSLVKIGTTAAQKKLFFSLHKIKKKLSNLYSRQVYESDFPEIAQELGVTTSEVAEMNSRMTGSDLSLNTPIGHYDESESELIDFIPETRPSQELQVIQQQEARNKHTLLVSAMRELNKRELEIFQSRRLKSEPSTLEELSNRYNVSKERIRQIENRAFEKVQHFMLAAQ